MPDLSKWLRDCLSLCWEKRISSWAISSPVRPLAISYNLTSCWSRVQSSLAYFCNPLLRFQCNCSHRYICALTRTHTVWWISTATFQFCFLARSGHFGAFSLFNRDTTVALLVPAVSLSHAESLSLADTTSTSLAIITYCKVASCF